MRLQVNILTAFIEGIGREEEDSEQEDKEELDQRRRKGKQGMWNVENFMKIQTNKFNYSFEIISHEWYVA